jgi:hypothetical protein
LACVTVLANNSLINATKKSHIFCFIIQFHIQEKTVYFVAPLESTRYDLSNSIRFFNFESIEHQDFIKIKMLIIMLFIFFNLDILRDINFRIFKNFKENL